MRQAAAGLVAALGLAAATAPAAALELRVGIAVERERVAIGTEGATLAAPDLGEAALTLGRETVLVWARAPAAPRARYRVQVASLADRGQAEALARRLGETLAPAEAAFHAESRTYRVRGGDFPVREAALAALASLTRAGWREAFAVEDGVPREPARLRMVLVEADRMLETAGPLRIEPQGAPLAVDGRRYRGAVEVRAHPVSGVVAINEVELEDYLRGVVPLEMGPEVYPELEALKAQAVAARTYAAASLGGFPDQGYDLCATARCQVYGGIGAEAALTDRAVAETAGLVLAHAGRPIRAYFSAVCGGHSEAAERVFAGDEPAPYLVPVECAPGPHEGFALPAGSRLPAVRAADGTPLAGPAALLWAAGVIDSVPAAEPLARQASGAETGRWVARAARLARPAAKEAPAGPGATVRLGRLLVHLVSAFGLEERAAVLVRRADREVLARFAGAPALSAAERDAAALLAGLGVLLPFADGQAHLEARASRGLVLALLHRLVEGLGAYPAVDGTLVAASGDRLTVRRRGETLSLALDAGTAFLREQRGQLVPFGGGRAVAGDSLRLWLDGERVRAMVVLEPVAGSDDRRARDARWTVSLTPERIEARLAASHAIGRLRDVTVIRRGESGRPLETRFTGSEGEATLVGYQLKRVLDLKDDLVVIEPQRAADGSLVAVRFAGRGWGHGVGLCQEGAFGMALRGLGARDILARYYPGAELVALTSLEAPAGAGPPP